MNYSNWYWIVGSDTDRVWSSASAKFLSAGHASYQAFKDAGNVATRIASVEELREVFANGYPGGMLETYAASKRWEKEVGGIVAAGMNVATDERSKQMILGARIAADADPNFTTQWAVAGEVYQLNAEQIIGISNAVLEHVRDCFAIYASIVAGINSDPPTITTRSQIDAVFAA